MSSLSKTIYPFVPDFVPTPVKASTGSIAEPKFSYSKSLVPASGTKHSVSRFAGKLLSTIFFLELAAGTAMLTSVVIQGGLRGLGIDSLRNRHKTIGPVAVFDLTVDKNVGVIL